MLPNACQQVNDLADLFDAHVPASVLGELVEFEGKPSPRDRAGVGG